MSAAYGLEFAKALSGSRAKRIESVDSLGGWVQRRADEGSTRGDGHTSSR